MRHEAIYNKYSQVTEIRGDGIPRDSNGDEVTIDESVVTTEINRLEAEFTNQDYARKRKIKYDALNQFELISDDSINSTTTHKDAILAIKSEFPKP
jgi:hypothetical protein